MGKRAVKANVQKTKKKKNCTLKRKKEKVAFEAFRPCDYIRQVSKAFINPPGAARWCGSGVEWSRPSPPPAAEAPPPAVPKQLLRHPVRQTFLSLKVLRKG